MADFTTVANETVTKLTSLLEHTEQAQTNVEESRAQIAQFSDQMESDWAELSSFAHSLLEQASSAKEELAAEDQETVQALAQLNSKIETLQNEAEPGIEEARATVTAINDKVETLNSELEEAFQEAEETLTALKEKTEEVATELEEVVSETEEHLRDVANSDLKTHQSEIEQHTEDLEASVAECQTEITTNVTELDEHFEEIKEQNATNLQAVEESTEQSAQSSTDQLLQSQIERFQSLVDYVKEVEELMAQFSELVDTHGDNVLTTKEFLVDATRKTIFAITLAVGILMDIKEILGQAL